MVGNASFQSCLKGIDMAVYNEIVAVTAGAGLIGVAAFLHSVINGKRINSEAWAAFFGVTGSLLFVLGVHTTVTWPFGGAPFEYANIAFGQPAAAFGALLLFATIYLWRNRISYDDDGTATGVPALEAFKPAAIFVGALGLSMAALAISFVRYQLGAAPPEEPISGRVGHLPWIEAIFLGGLWGIVAIGCLLFAYALWAQKTQLLRWVVWAWMLGGIAFLLFGAMNYYTHIGMYYNFEHGTNYKW